MPFPPLTSSPSSNSTSSTFMPSGQSFAPADLDERLKGAFNLFEAGIGRNCKELSSIPAEPSDSYSEPLTAASFWLMPRSCASFRWVRPPSHASLLVRWLGLRLSRRHSKRLRGVAPNVGELHCTQNVGPAAKKPNIDSKAGKERYRILETLSCIDQGVRHIGL